MKTNKKLAISITKKKQGGQWPKQFNSVKFFAYFYNDKFKL